MKKPFISFLIMTLMLTNISLINTSSVQAATVDDTTTANDTATTDNSTTKISLENIRDIIIENNLDLKTKDNELKIAKETRDSAKDNQTTKPTKPDSADPDYDAKYLIYQEDLDTYEKKMAAYETAKTAYKTAKTNYDQKVESAVYSAQTAYLTYLSDLSTNQINEDTLTYNNKKANIYKIQYESGFMSKKDYTAKLQGDTSITTSQNNLDKAKDAQELDRIKLCNMLGISSDEKVTFNTDMTVDFLVISKINYEDDLKQMLDNSLNIKDKNDAIDDLEDEEDTTYKDKEDIYNYKHDNVEIDLKQAISTAETNFKGKYNDLMASYNLVKSSYDKIIEEQREFKVTEVQYDYGFVSKNILDNAKITLDKDNASFIKSRNDCYLKYLNYIQMKEGY